MPFTIGYHASHEQFSPAELLELVRLAESQGFAAAMSSDHISPWSATQGESGAPWPWLGAAMQATNMPFGSLCVPCGWRYHPVTAAHNFATLAQLFPDRLKWIAVGSGEFLNEHVVGMKWPNKEERNTRLHIGAEIIRALWNSETVTRQQGPILVDRAKLWSLPEHPPKLYIAALSPETAKWGGGWADGLITVNKAPEELQLVIEAFRAGGGSGKPMALQVHVSWAEDDEAALRHAYDQWRNNVLPPGMLADLATVEEFDAAAKAIRPEEMKEHVLIASDPKRYISWLNAYGAMGFNEIFVHNVGRNQREFIHMFGREVVPFLR